MKGNGVDVSMREPTNGTEVRSKKKIEEEDEEKNGETEHKRTDAKRPTKQRPSTSSGATYIREHWLTFSLDVVETLSSSITHSRTHTHTHTVRISLSERVLRLKRPTMFRPSWKKKEQEEEGGEEGEEE